MERPPSAPRSHRVLGNIGALALGRGTSTALSFVLLPVIVRYLGHDAYGLYVLLMTITGYFTLLDFGVSPALTKYVAEYRGRGDLGRAYRVINSTLLYYLLVGVAAAAGLAGMSLVANRLFRLDPALQPVARRLFLIAAAFALVLWPTNTFRGVMEAYQRYRASAFVTAGCQSVAALVAVGTLVLGRGVTMLLVLTNLGMLAANLTFYVLLRRDEPSFRPTVLVRDAETLGLIFRFSTYMFVGGLASLVVFQLDNLVVGAFLSMAAVAVYNVAYLLHSGVKMIDNLIGAPPWVAGAEMEGQGDHGGQQRLFLRGTRYVAGFFLPGIALLIVFADPLIPHWMGPGFRDSVLPARVLVSGWLVASLWETGAGVVTAKGVVRPLTLIAVANAALNAVLSIGLVRVIGIVGVALGTTLPFLVVAPFVWRVILNTLDVRPSRVFDESLRGAIAPLLLCVAVGGALLRLLPPPTLMLTLVEMAVAYAVAVGTAYASALNADDRLLVRGFLKHSLEIAGARQA